MTTKRTLVPRVAATALSCLGCFLVGLMLQPSAGPEHAPTVQARPADAAAASLVTQLRPGDNVQAALDAARKGGVVRLEPGDYRVDRRGVALASASASRGRRSICRPNGWRRSGSRPACC